MYGNVPVRFGRGRLDSLDIKGLAAYLIATRLSVRWCRGRSGAVCSVLVAMQEVDTRRSSTWVPDSRPMCQRVKIPLASTKSEASGNDLRRIGDVKGELVSRLSMRSVGRAGGPFWGDS